MSIRPAVNPSAQNEKGWSPQDFVILTSIGSVVLVALAFFFADAAMQLMSPVLPDDQTWAWICGVITCVCALFAVILAFMAVRTLRQLRRP